jgi:SAM-dependent methyltransferase
MDLGKQPNTNMFPAKKMAHKEPTYPISMKVCTDCWQVQLATFPNPKLLFRNHPYVSGLNTPVVDHFKKLSGHIVKKYSLPRGSLVLDIGCNDGSLLRCFADHGMKTLGVDPGNRTAVMAKAKGITVKKIFWNEKVGKQFAAERLFPDLICATAVFYHVPDLHDFVRGLGEVMRGRSICVIQCLYLKDVIEKNQFENIYHEHRAIHAVTPLIGLFARHNLRVLDVEYSSIHGGSFILYVGRADHPQKTTKRVAEAVAAEHAAKLDRLITYTRFTKRAQKNTKALRTLLMKLRKNHKRIYALGAPAKGNTLLNAAHITPELISCATEVNPFKIGRVLPGSHIPIVDEQKIAVPPEYYLLLSWNYLPFFRKKYASFLATGGKFIVPIPSVHIVDASLS